ncbi:MAG: WYL domain-containing protein [Lachnospiraceae bacterium]|nr:WYL domain-containing protein [Lachnospiraceae bacterium]
MPKENWQKIKLLKLVDLLRQETDEQHPLTTAQICERLKEMDIPCDRRILSKDIELLNDNGIEVLWTWVGKGKGYYIEDRNFSVPELKIMIDSVQAASFITEKKTKELVNKIAGQGGTNRAAILKSNLAHFNTRKHTNESIYCNVDAIEDAIQRRKKIIFRYYDLNIKGKRAYRRDGHHYVVEPVALVYNEDNYYAVVYSSRHDNKANYRVDRMDNVEVIDEDISEKALALRDSVGKYTEQAIKMYGGELQTVILEFDLRLIGAVYDRFGEKISMMPAGIDKVAATVDVQISPTFWGWLFQFGKQMRVISPEVVVKEQRERIEELMG